jgi:hypothetical protein
MISNITLPNDMMEIYKTSFILFVFALKVMTAVLMLFEMGAFVCSTCISFMDYLFE